MLFDEAYYLAINEARWTAAKAIIDDEIRRGSGVELNTCFDVGCGPGWFSGKLVSLGLDVEGLEGRAELAEEAARRVPQARFHQVDLESRAGTSRFEPRDLVFCFGLLYHTENPFRVVRNLAALTGKVLFVESQVIPEQGPVAWLIEEGRNETQGLTYHAMIPSRSALLKMIQSAGFEHVYESHHPIDHADFHDTSERHRRRRVILASRIPLKLSQSEKVGHIPTPKYNFEKKGAHPL